MSNESAAPAAATTTVGNNTTVTIEEGAAVTIVAPFQGRVTVRLRTGEVIVVENGYPELRWETNASVPPAGLRFLAHNPTDGTDAWGFITPNVAPNKLGVRVCARSGRDVLRAFSFRPWHRSPR